MHRREAQKLCLEKLDDARFLLQAGRSSNAYYLAGYAIELALKSCIARRFQSQTIPDPQFVKSIYVHKLSELMKVAELANPLQVKMQADPQFAANWAQVILWSEASRYTAAGHDISKTRSFISAIEDPVYGVLTWLKSHW